MQVTIVEDRAPWSKQVGSAIKEVTLSKDQQAAMDFFKRAMSVDNTEDHQTINRKLYTMPDKIKDRKPTARCSSTWFRHQLVPVPTVPVPKSSSASSGSGISAHSQASPPRTETSRGVFIGPQKQPKNVPQTPKTKNVQNSYK